jgi:hypothetical protein
MNTKFPHIPTFFGGENIGEVNKAYVGRGRAPYVMWPGIVNVGGRVVQLDGRSSTASLAVHSWGGRRMRRRQRARSVPCPSPPLQTNKQNQRIYPLLMAYTFDP